MSNTKINKKAIAAIIAAVAVLATGGVIAISTLNAPAEVAPSATHTAAAPSKTSTPKADDKSESEDKTITKTISNEGVTFAPCNLWAAKGATEGSGTYEKDAACLILTTITNYASEDGVVCEAKSNGDSAVGIQFKDKDNVAGVAGTPGSYTCVYEVPAGA